MGIFDAIKSAISSKEPEPDVTVAVPPEVPAEPPVVEPSPESPEPAAVDKKTYTVKSGDSLWKIAEEMYGNGSKYMKIFEANSDLLENPDRIFPGQELLIPDLDD